MSARQLVSIQLIVLSPHLNDWKQRTESLSRILLKRQVIKSSTDFAQ